MDCSNLHSVNHFSCNPSEKLTAQIGTQEGQVAGRLMKYQEASMKAGITKTTRKK